MAVIWETTDRLGRVVGLSDDAWAHIQDRHHDQLEDHLQIRYGIERAEEIVRDRSFRHREIHYRHNRSGNGWLRVVVNYRPHELHGWAGNIITAHITNRRNRGEVLIWPSRNHD